MTRNHVYNNSLNEKKDIVQVKIWMRRVIKFFIQIIIIKLLISRNWRLFGESFSFRCYGGDSGRLSGRFYYKFSRRLYIVGDVFRIVVVFLPPNAGDMLPDFWANIFWFGLLLFSFSPSAYVCGRGIAFSPAFPFPWSGNGFLAKFGSG